MHLDATPRTTLRYLFIIAATVRGWDIRQMDRWNKRSATMKCWISWMWSRWASAICICWRCTLMLYPSFPLFLSSRDKGRKVSFNLRCQEYRKYTSVAGKVRSDINVIEVYCSCASWQSLNRLNRCRATVFSWYKYHWRRPWDLICGLWLCGISLDFERLRIGSVDVSAVSGPWKWWGFWTQLLGQEIQVLQVFLVSMETWDGLHRCFLLC